MLIYKAVFKENLFFYSPIEDIIAYLENLW
jgi:hypothetical protein